MISNTIGCCEVMCIILCRCMLQNCVVCSHAHIEDKVTLKDCLVGANFTVTKEGMI